MFLFHPFIPKEEILKALDEVLSTRWVGEGEKVQEFEGAFSSLIGNPFCVAVNSGTSALDLAYDCIGLGKGDEVITPVLTCTATNHPLLRRGCHLVFSDVEAETLNPDVEDIMRKITKKTKAIVVVHLNGNPIENMKMELLKRTGIPIIEDCCQAIGASYDPVGIASNQMVGNSGNYCAFSFQAIKTITTGDGGMLVCPNEEKYKEAKRKRWFGIDRDRKKSNNWHPIKDREITFDVTEVGFKYHMNNLSAVMGLVGMKWLTHLIRQRRFFKCMYDAELKMTPMFHHGGSSVWTYGVFVDDSFEFIRHMENKGIESNVVQVRNDIYKVFGGKRRNLTNINKLEHGYAYLPIHQNLTIEDINKVIEVANGF